MTKTTENITVEKCLYHCRKMFVPYVRVVVIVGGFKKKMKPNQPSGHKEVEMGVRYQSQGERGTVSQSTSSL